MLETEFRTSGRQHKLLAAGPLLQPPILFSFFETGSHVGLELIMH